MKYLVISDIHGCTDNLQKALQTPHAHDGIILLGDYLNHGPRNPILQDYDPLAVADILNKLQKPIAVRGNCDSEVDQALLDFEMSSDYKLLQIDDKTIFITHGHIYEPEKDAPNLNYDVFLSGHTHLPYITQHEYGITMNPGSVAMPKGGHPATYGLISANTLYIYTMDHNIYLELEQSSKG